VDQNGGRLAGRYERRPPACVYCANVPDTDEHAFGRGIGGRLSARILCKEHNGTVGSAVDDPMATRFAPLMTVLSIPRQGLEVAGFAGTLDDGSPVRVSSVGKITGPSLNKVISHATDDAGRLARGEANLSVLESLAAGGKLTDGAYVIATGAAPPPINTTLQADELTERAALKVALHFVAGFVADIDRAIADTLLPYLLGQERAGGTYARTIVWSETLTPHSWPLRHEVTVYPGNDATYVTVLFFDWCAYKVRLPFGVALDDGRRYTQVLGETFPRFDDNVPLQAVEWDVEWTATERKSFDDHLQGWNSAVGKAAGLQDLRNTCRRASERAREAMKTNGMSFDACYESELHIERVNGDLARGLVEQGRKLVRNGKEVWEVDVEVRLDPEF
jgi:hypothetical protein